MDASVPPNQFVSLFGSLAREVQETYARAAAEARRANPQRAGREGEATWVSVLGEWGPNWPVVTRKYVVGPGGSSSEVDLLIMKPDYPKQLLALSHVLSSGIAAAFEVRLSFRKADLAHAIKKKRELIAVAGNPQARLNEALRGPFPFGLLSHSTTAFPKDVDCPGLMARSYYATAYGGPEPLVTRPAEDLDAWLIADRGFGSVSRASTRGGTPPTGPESTFIGHFNNLDEPGTPIAQFVVWLSGNWGWPGAPIPSLTALRPIIGLGGAAVPKLWPLEVYPALFRRPSNILSPEGFPFGF